MIIKGIVSAVHKDINKVEVILPEYNGVVTEALRVYGGGDVESFKVNDFVMVVIFNGNYNDGVIIPPALESSKMWIEMTLFYAENVILTGRW